MKKLKVALLIAAVFLAGFASGVVVTRGVVRHLVQGIVNNPGRVRDLVEKRMAARLRLDPAQRARVHDVLANTQSDLTSLRSEFQPRCLAIMNQAQSNITAVLTPDQLQKFDKFKAENRHLWQPK